MRLKSAVLALSLCLVCLLPNRGFADTLTLTGVGGANTDGVYIYPYEFTVTGPAGTSTDVFMSCLNFNREIYFGETWTVDEASVLSIGSGGLDGESQQAYLEDAYLFNLYAAATTEQQVSDLQFAIWYVMDPTSDVTGESGYDANAASLVSLAQANYDTVGSLAADANDDVFVPVAGGYPAQDGEPQIFVVDPLPLAFAPEPSGLVLFGTGLLGCVFILRRRMLPAQAGANSGR